MFKCRENGSMEIDNNKCERAMRRIVVGQKGNLLPTRWLLLILIIRINAIHMGLEDAKM